MNETDAPLIGSGYIVKNINSSVSAVHVTAISTLNSTLTRTLIGTSSCNGIAKIYSDISATTILNDNTVVPSEYIYVVGVGQADSTCSLAVAISSNNTVESPISVNVTLHMAIPPIPLPRVINATHLDFNIFSLTARSTGSVNEVSPSMAVIENIPMNGTLYYVSKHIYV